MFYIMDNTAITIKKAWTQISYVTYQEITMKDFLPEVHLLVVTKTFQNGVTLWKFCAFYLYTYL